LVGLNLEADQGATIRNKNEKEKNAFRFSFCKVNEFPTWFSSLMKQYHSHFIEISDELIFSVWDTGHEQGEFPGESLSKIAYSSYEVPNVIAPLLLEKSKQRKPSKIPWPKLLSSFEFVPAVDCALFGWLCKGRSFVSMRRVDIK
jgi:hypothetical protein